MVRLVLLPVPDLGPCSRPALSPCFVHGYGLVLVPGSSPALHMVLVLVLVPNLVGPGSGLFQVLVCYWFWPPSGGSDLVGPGSGCFQVLVWSWFWLVVVLVLVLVLVQVLASFWSCLVLAALAWPWS